MIHSAFIQAGSQLARWLSALGVATDSGAFHICIEKDLVLGEGFAIQAGEAGVRIASGSPGGAVYGVYAFLEEMLGCRFLAEDCILLPQGPLELKTGEYSSAPAFSYRELYWRGALPADTALQLRLNASRGGLPRELAGGPRFYNYSHSFDALVDPEVWFDSHPEYFSLVGGVRQKEQSQLCLTNKEVLALVIDKVRAWMREHPDCNVFSVSMNDWYAPCECAACAAIDAREGSQSGSLLSFINQVADAVQAEFPDNFIHTFAYLYGRKPPRTLSARDNVIIRLCPIERCFSHGIDVCGAEARLIDVKAARTAPFSEGGSFRSDLQGWAQACRHLYIWDYTTNFRLYIAPFPNVRALQENVRFFRDNHVIGLFEQGAYQGRHADFAELKGWLLAKWLWNPELPAEPLLKTFFEGYYGAAAPQVRQYFDEVHGFYGVTTNAPLRIFDDVKAPIIPDEFYVRAEKLWQQAEAAVQDSPAHLYNVRMGAVPVLAARLARLPTHEPKKVWVTSDPMQHAVPAEHRRLAKELLTRFGEAKNKRLSEGAESHERILETWRFLSGPGVPPAAEVKTSATVEDTALSLGNRGTWGDTVADPLAEDGSAMKLNNTHYEWCTTLRFSQVAFDPGARYRIRMRVRVEKKPGQTGEALWSGVCDA